MVDLVENMGDRTPGTSWPLRFWWKVVFRMWNRPRPAPEYRFGWRDAAAARMAIERILTWDVDRVVLAHGEPIDSDAGPALREAWRCLRGRTP